MVRELTPAKTWETANIGGLIPAVGSATRPPRTVGAAD